MPATTTIDDRRATTAKAAKATQGNAQGTPGTVRRGAPGALPFFGLGFDLGGVVRRALRPRNGRDQARD